MRVATTQAETSPRGTQSDRTLQPARILPWFALAALLMVAIVLRHLLASSTDIGWLLTVGERVLGGQRLYVDVIETNPPMAVLAYLPGIVVARVLGVSAEIAVDGLVFAAIFASLGIAARILGRSSALGDLQPWPLLLLAFAVLAILPTQTFGQREHMALIAMLPMLAVTAVRMKAEKPSLTEAIVAGLGAAIALSFKPYFALGLIGALAVLAISTRISWRILLLPECMTIAAGMVLYIGIIIVLFPEFLTAIGPLVRDVYLPVQLSLFAMLEKPALSLWAMALLAAFVLKRRSGANALFVALAATSVGFAAAFILQRKGWPYHSYPMIALALLGLGCALLAHVSKTKRDRAFVVGGLILLVALFARSMLWFDVAFDARPLQERVLRLGPYPAILAISGEPGIGHPLVRAVGGTWVSRQQALWVVTYLQAMRAGGGVDPARDRLLEAYAARERAMLIEDIRKVPPTVVLVDDLTGTGSAWLNAHPDVAELLKDFRLLETVNNVAILTRRN